MLLFHQINPEVAYPSDHRRVAEPKEPSLEQKRRMLDAGLLADDQVIQSIHRALDENGIDEQVASQLERDYVLRGRLPSFICPDVEGRDI